MRKLCESHADACVCVCVCVCVCGPRVFVSYSCFLAPKSRRTTATTLLFQNFLLDSRVCGSRSHCRKVPECERILVNGPWVLISAVAFWHRDHAAHQPKCWVVVTSPSAELYGCSYQPIIRNVGLQVPAHQPKSRVVVTSPSAEM